jgi:hypothetical protein
MSQKERLNFFRRALRLCVKFQRSPQVAGALGGRPKTLRELMIAVGEGSRPPAITEDEARLLAPEFPSLSYDEILTGLSGRASTRASKPGARTRGRARAGATA